MAKHKFNPDCADCVREKKAADRLRAKADKAAVRIVSMVSKRHSGGKLYAYAGIEAAREVREFLIKTFR